MTGSSPLFSRDTLIRLARAGLFGVVAVYGPAIWLVMSLLVIPALVERPPNLTVRWWVQLLGHFPFVGIPFVAGSVGWALPRAGGSGVAGRGA